MSVSDSIPKHTVSSETDSPICRPRSIVLAAHGSLAAANSNQPLFDLANAIANHENVKQFFGDSPINVTPAFLNGDPEMVNVLDQLPVGDAVVVPVMTSQGYYLKALPGKYAQNKTAAQFRVYMAPVVGVHPSIASIISQRIVRILNEYQLDPANTTIAVIGHGTRRNKNSCKSTLALTDALVENLSITHPALQLKTGFLDQDPEASEVAAGISTKNTLVIPFLISRGPHTTVDVPESFGLPAGPDIEFPLVSASETRVCICDSPLGLFPEMADVCLQLAIETINNGTPIKLPFDSFEPESLEQELTKQELTKQESPIRESTQPKSFETNESPHFTAGLSANTRGTNQ
ncbi:MAG: CbiX/SirB N-terminal domain-containing protein [Mariniblastus sp.]